MTYCHFLNNFNDFNVTIFADNESSVGTCTAIEEMFPGDEIRVTGDDNFAGVAKGDGFSGFTGYLIARLDD